MTADGQDTSENEGQRDHEEDRVRIRLPDLFVSYEPFLRRLRFTDTVASAVEELQSLNLTSWRLDEQVRLRLVCVRILEEYAEALEGESGDLPAGTVAHYALTRQTLAFLRETLEDDRRALANFAEDLEESGYELDPEAPGGFKVRTGKPGKPRSAISEAVKQLLREWQPEDWDDEGYFTGEESGELRERLFEALTTSPPTDRAWTSLLPPGEASFPFPRQQVDPRRGGPISKAIQNLRYR